MLNSSYNQSSWNPRFFEQGGLFDLFQPWSEWFMHHREAFPSLDALNALIVDRPSECVVSGGGFPVKFVKQQRVGRGQRRELSWQADYQMRIFLSGEVPSRPNNWHDFFNAWTWILFPRSKAALNVRHFICADESYAFPWKRSPGNRNTEQDFLTLFDEGGLIVVCESDEIWQLLLERRWPELFVENHDRLRDEVLFLPLGHALFDCAIAGNPKIHASSLRVRLDPRELKNRKGPLSSGALALIDEELALLLMRRQSHSHPDSLAAVPIWGIPGWHPNAGDSAFTSDRSYFR